MPTPRRTSRNPVAYDDLWRFHVIYTPLGEMAMFSERDAMVHFVRSLEKGGRVFRVSALDGSGKSWATLKDIENA